MHKYIIKLINGDKLETNEYNFNQWLYSSGDDFIICFGDSGIPLYLKKNRILLGFIIELKQEESNEEIKQEE